MIEAAFTLSDVVGDLTKDIESIASAARDGLFAGGKEVMDIISWYPPTSEANEPGPYPKKWYVRGVGSHWALKGGGFNFRRNSQQLNKRWAIKQLDDGNTVVIGNNATYAPYVHDQTMQPAFHSRRGWRTAQEVLTEQGREIVIENIRNFVKAELDRRNKS